MSITDANVQTNLRIDQFIAAARQFANDPNLSAKYWPMEYYKVIWELSEKLWEIQTFCPSEEPPKIEHNVLSCEVPKNVQLSDVFK